MDSKLRKSYNEFMKDYMKNQYNLRKIKGVCTKCGKTPLMTTIYCEQCVNERREYRLRKIKEKKEELAEVEKTE